MAWSSSDRASRLPADWDERRAFVRARAGGRCEALLHDGTRCPAAGAECDHVEPGDDHRATNLQWLCSWHHKRKTQREAAAALAAERARTRPPPGTPSPPTQDTVKSCRFLFVRVWGNIKCPQALIAQRKRRGGG